MPESEVLIGRRLAEARRRFKAPRPWLALQTGFGADAIERVELGRVPLKFGMAKRILDCLEFNAAWLATGQGDFQLFVSLDDAKVLGVPENALFSEVFAKFFARILEGTDPQTVPVKDGGMSLFQGAWRRLRQLEMLSDCFQEILDRLRDWEVEQFCSHVRLVAESYAKGRPSDSREMILARKRLHGLERRQADKDYALERLRKKIFDLDSEIGKTEPVKTEMQRLLETVRKLATRPGQKAALAQFLGVSQSRVSEWLAGVCEPGGQNTLKLLRWVEEQERARR